MSSNYIHWKQPVRNSAIVIAEALSNIFHLMVNYVSSVMTTLQGFSFTKIFRR